METRNANAKSVLFVHGLWLHASSWQPWVDLFTSNGYSAAAPGWPGDAPTVDGCRSDPQAIAGRGVGDVVAHYRNVIAGMPTKPIVIGHSFGGLVAQALLGLDVAAGAIAINAAQIKGVRALPLTTLRATSTVFKDPRNRKRAVSLTRKQFRYAFGNAIPASESDMLHERWAIPAPGRPLFEAASANFRPSSATKVATGNETRGPLLLTMGGRDHTVPPAITRSTARLYRPSAAITDVLSFDDRGHSLTIDAGWHEVAHACLDWLGKRMPAEVMSSDRPEPL